MTKSDASMREQLEKMDAEYDRLRESIVQGASWDDIIYRAQRVMKLAFKARREY